MKYKFFILLLLTLQIRSLSFANMASPVFSGTISSSAISSKNIHIESESIFIKIDKNFTSAKYIVEYNIRSNVSGKQMPLLFYAIDYKDNFLVWVNNKPVSVKNVSELNMDQSSFIKKYENGNDSTKVAISFDKNERASYEINDLKYFEIDIEKGNHVIRVEYDAKAWVDKSDWVKKYSFQYSLSPAKYWQSFSNLTIKIEQEGTVKQYTTNLGSSNENKIASLNTWNFKNLPSDFITINFQPNPKPLAVYLISLEPFGIAVILSVIFMLLHLYWVIWYRRRNISKKFSFPVIIGSLLVPFLYLFIYIYSYSVIDYIIGTDASKWHGYIALIIFFYPFIVLIYWVVFWLMDKLYKKQLLNKQ
jgi:hypothetical protein